MSKLWLIGLAASAAWTPAALAQGAPAPMAHGARGSGHGGMVMHGGGHHVMPPAMHGGGHMKGMHRFGRGHIVPPHFRHQQFFVNDWRMFGFPAPMPGGHWIRYYDDALLIDGDGRVMDGRYGFDWDRRGDRMAYDDEGYDDRDRDDRDYDDRDHDGGRDHDRGDYGRDKDWDDDRYGRRHHDKGDRVVRVYRHGGKGDCRRSCTRVRHLPPPPHPGYGYGYGYGHGYGYGYGYGAGCACGPVVVTETITTTAPVVETHTYYETVTEHRAAPRRHYSKPVVRYSKPVRRSVKAAPRPGERG